MEDRSSRPDGEQGTFVAIRRLVSRLRLHRAKAQLRRELVEGSA